MKLQVLGILLGLFHVIYAVPQPSYMNALQSLLEDYVQKEDEPPSENFKKELLEGGQPAIGVQQDELETDHGKLHHFELVILME